MKMKSMKFLSISGSLLAVAFLSGCALTPDHIRLAYVPQANVSKIDGADVVSVRVAVTDSRSIRDKVSAKKNGFGMEMAPIIAQEDVADTLKKAIEAELANRGFRLNDGMVAIATELRKFYSDFKVGFWSGSALAEVTMDIQVKKPDGSLSFSKRVAGKSRKDRLMLASGENAKAALDDALKDAIAKLFADSEFIKALLQTSKA